MARLLVVTLFVGGLATSTASAQLCTGSASFAHRPWQLAAGAGFNKDGKSFTGGLGFGGAGPFVQLAAGKSSYDQFDGASSTDLGVGAGWQFAVDTAGVFHLCPLASFTQSSGPKDVAVGAQLLDISSKIVSLGLGLGVVANRASRTQIIPSASFGFASTKLKATALSGQSTTSSETLGFVDFGVGILFGQAFSIRPTVVLAFGVEESSTTYGASMTVNFGRRGTP